MNIFKRIKASLRLYDAVRNAEKAHTETGHRYYVMPMAGKKHNLVIMNRDNFRKLKRKRYIRSGVTVSDLEKECFYCTPYRDGKDALPDFVIDMKRKEYFSWVETK